MIERTEERFALRPGYLAGDAAYGTGEMLGCGGRPVSALPAHPKIAGAGVFTDMPGVLGGVQDRS